VRKSAKSWFLAGREPVRPLAAALNLLIALCLVGLVFYYAFAQLHYQWGWASVYRYRDRFISGWLVTIELSLLALVCSTFIGLAFALAQASRVLLVRFLSKLYIEAVRGTPLLVQILIFFYVVADAFHIDNRNLVGVLTLSFFSGAYISEVIRAGIEGVGQSQIESARAIGLTPLQTFRYVIFPQAIRQVLPPLAGQFVSLVKDSSLLSVIAINEFTLNAREVNSYTYSTLECYIPLAFGYLILTLPISLWTRSLERRYRYET
jgi:polar amino acid transport system permease protein